MKPMDKRIQSAFGAVHADEAMKARTAAFLSKKLYDKPRRLHLSRAIPAVCCALFVLIACAGYGVYSMPVAAISVEAGETVELKVNAFDRVVSYTCLSSGTETDVEALNLTHQTYSDAVAALVESSGSEEAAVSVAAGSEEKNAAIAAEIETRCQGVNCQSADAETLEAASEVGLGVQKYAAYLEWKSLDPSVTPEDAQTLSMREIREKIAALSGEDSATTGGNGPQDGTGQQSGNGQQSGTGLHDGTGQQNGGGAQDGTGQQNGGGQGSGHRYGRN